MPVDKYDFYKEEYNTLRDLLQTNINRSETRSNILVSIWSGFFAISAFYLKNGNPVNLLQKYIFVAGVIILIGISIQSFGYLTQVLIRTTESLRNINKNRRLLHNDIKGNKNDNILPLNYYHPRLIKYSINCKYSSYRILIKKLIHTIVNCLKKLKDIKYIFSKREYVTITVDHTEKLGRESSTNEKVEYKVKYIESLLRDIDKNNKLYVYSGQEKEEEIDYLINGNFIDDLFNLNYPDKEIYDFQIKINLIAKEYAKPSLNISWHELVLLVASINSFAITILLFILFYFPEQVCNAKFITIYISIFSLSLYIHRHYLKMKCLEFENSYFEQKSKIL